MTIESGRYRRSYLSINCPQCGREVIGMWYEVGPKKEAMCAECHLVWESEAMGLNHDR